MTTSQYLNLNKKTLIISSYAPPQVGGAQNLYNLLININKDYYFLLTNEKSLEDINRGGKKLPCQYYFFTTIKGRLYKFYHALKIGKKIIKKEKIDIIIAVSDGGFSFLITLILSLTSNKKYTLFFFDLFNGNNLPLNKRFTKYFEQILINKAKKLIVTNKATANYYKKIYKNIDIEIIYNSIFDYQYKKINQNNNYISQIKITRITFTGNIGWPQKNSIMNLINMIKNNEELNIILNIYCPHPPDDIILEAKNSDKINISYAIPSDMPKIQSEADILFLPLAWNTPAPDIIKTASPGKLTDYLIAGRPILIHAPDYSFVAKYAKENNFAEVVDKEDPELLRLAIKKLTENEEYANQLVTNAKKVFYQNHDAKINSEKLVNIINSL